MPARPAPETAARLARIVALARQGLRPIDIAARLGATISRDRVAALLSVARRADPTIPRFRGGPPRRGRAERMLTLARAGLRSSEIADALGCNVRRVNEVLSAARARGAADAPAEGAPPPPAATGDSARALRARGFTPTQIAARLRRPYREIEAELRP